MKHFPVFIAVLVVASGYQGAFATLQSGNRFPDGLQLGDNVFLRPRGASTGTISMSVGGTSVLDSQFYFDEIGAFGINNFPPTTTDTKFFIEHDTDGGETIRLGNPRGSDSYWSLRLTDAGPPNNGLVFTGGISSNPHDALALHSSGRVSINTLVDAGGMLVVDGNVYVGLGNANKPYGALESGEDAVSGFSSQDFFLINSYEYNGDGGGVAINVHSYAGGAQSSYRNFVVADGRGSNILTITGSTRVMSLSGTALLNGASWTSDERLKTNIEDQDKEHSLDAIRRLRPVTYEWKREHTDKKVFANRSDGLPYYGLIAQQLESVLPQAVQEFAEDEQFPTRKGVAYEQVVSVLVSAFQQLDTAVQEKNQDYERRIAELEDKVRELTLGKHA